MKPLLIVDDREDDRYLLERALRNAGVSNSILNFSDGRELVSYLTGPGIYIARRSFPAPTVLFLDLDMPRMDGYETLAWLHEHKRAEDFFVVAVTALSRTEQIKSAYALGARSYLRKPLDVEELKNLIQYYPAYWEHREQEPSL